MDYNDRAVFWYRHLTYKHVVEISMVLYLLMAGRWFNHLYAQYSHTNNPTFGTLASIILSYNLFLLVIIYFLLDYEIWTLEGLLPNFNSLTCATTDRTARKVLLGTGLTIAVMVYDKFAASGSEDTPVMKRTKISLRSQVSEGSSVHN